MLESRGTSGCPIHDFKLALIYEIIYLWHGAFQRRWRCSLQLKPEVWEVMMGLAELQDLLPYLAGPCPSTAQSLSSTTIWGRSSHQSVPGVIRGGPGNPVPPQGGPSVTSLRGPEAPTRVGLSLLLGLVVIDHGSLPPDRRAPGPFLSPPDESQEAAARSG